MEGGVVVDGTARPAKARAARIERLGTRMVTMI